MPSWSTIGRKTGMRIISADAVSMKILTMRITTLIINRINSGLSVIDSSKKVLGCYNYNHRAECEKNQGSRAIEFIVELLIVFCAINRNY